VSLSRLPKRAAARPAATMAPVSSNPPEQVSGLRSLVRRIIRRPAGLWSVNILGAFAVVAVFGPQLAPYDPLAQVPSAALSAPSLQHLLGMDELGRDVLSRMVYGTRVSMSAGFVAVGIALIIGVPLGLASGLLRGRVDELIMRTMDAMIAFPGLLLAIAVISALGPGIQNVMIAIGVVSVPIYTRLVRAQAMSAARNDYVMAAVAVGASQVRIAVVHILPNVAAPVIVQASLALGGAILAEAGLSFLGVGITPPTPTWGSIMQEGLSVLRIFPWLSVVPGLAIFLVVLSLNALGDVLRDELDPRARSR
jgi:peptide/nickel transport system permease protein